jgi:PLP dependent protein
MDVKNKLETLNNQIPENVKLVAVSKTKPAGLIQEFYNCGQRVFGENKAQEMATKYDELPKDIEWHFIGHLQTNKVKYISPFVSCIHSLESISLLQEINKKALLNNRIINCLLQIYISTDDTKFGMDTNELDDFFIHFTSGVYKNVNICGVMGMATFTDNETKIRKEFQYLKNIFSIVKQKYFYESHEFKEISMGMSGDYKIAIEEGSTIVRIGSTLFGER